ncbi:MAG TPA: PH domain-containing protein [Acidimicrobiales bacterium]|nr:PH domain-containing protein [Acidimicrobiales bacterium]
MATQSELDAPAPPAPARAPDAARPRRLHPASPVLDVSTLGRQLVGPGVVALGAGGAWVLAVGVALVLAVRVLAWWRRTYVLDGGVLRVESGILVRNQQLVPCERIQQVNLVRKLRHRSLGVAVLTVETAVGGGAGLRLEALAASEADRLRRRLLAAKSRATGTVPAPATALAAAVEASQPEPAVPAEQVVVRLTHRQLAVAGLTGAQLLVVFVFAATVLQFVDDLAWRPLRQLDPSALQVVGPAFFVVAAAGFVAVWLGTAAAAAIVADSGYTLSLMGDELHVRRGLLDRKEATLPLARVQAVRVAVSLPRRLLGLVSVRIDSAGGGAEAEDSRVGVPVLPAAHLDRVLARVVPGIRPLPPLRRPPRAALRRAVVRRVGPAAALAVVVALAVPPWGALALLAVPAAALAGVASYRGLGHALDEGVLIARSGAFIRHTVVVPLGRAQSGRVQSTPLQRRAGLATLLVDLAGPGRPARVVDESAATAERLLVSVVGSTVP